MQRKDMAAGIRSHSLRMSIILLCARISLINLLLSRLCPGYQIDMHLYPAGDWFAEQAFGVDLSTVPRTRHIGVVSQMTKYNLYSLCAACKGAHQVSQYRKNLIHAISVQRC